MIDNRTAAVPQRKMSLKAYKKAKRQILERDFYIKMTVEEKARLEAAKTEIQVEQICLGIINQRWG